MGKEDEDRQESRETKTTGEGSGWKRCEKVRETRVRALGGNFDKMGTEISQQVNLKKAGVKSMEELELDNAPEMLFLAESGIKR